jgi:hypothetical protein
MDELLTAMKHVIARTVEEVIIHTHTHTHTHTQEHTLTNTHSHVLSHAQLALQVCGNTVVPNLLIGHGHLDRWVTLFQSLLARNDGMATAVAAIRTLIAYVAMTCFPMLAQCIPLLAAIGH